MMKLFKIAFLPLLAGILLLPAASRPVRAAGSAAVEAGAGDRKRDKKKKQEADTAAKATPYEKLFKDKRVETVRGGGLTLHLTADKLYLELPDSLLGRGLMITTTSGRAIPATDWPTSSPCRPTWSSSAAGRATRSSACGSSLRW